MRAAITDTRAGTPIATIVADSSLLKHQDLFNAAIQATTLALRNRIMLEQVRESRARIMEAALMERRRLERDLHDGAHSACSA